MNPIETKEITLDGLAAMINEGFLEARDDLNEFRAEVKEEFADVRSEIDDLRRLVVSDHGRRLRKIESKLQIA